MVDLEHLPDQSLVDALGVKMSPWKTPGGDLWATTFVGLVWMALTAPNMLLEAAPWRAFGRHPAPSSPDQRPPPSSLQIESHQVLVEWAISAPDRHGTGKAQERAVLLDQLDALGIDEANEADLVLGK